MDRVVAGEPIFLKADSADVGSRLGQLGLKAYCGFAPWWNGSQLLLFVLSVDAELDQSIFDFRATEIRDRGFETKRQIDADTLTGKTDFFDGAVQRLLLLSRSNGFQRDRWIILFERRGRKLIPAGQTHVGNQPDFLLPRGFVQQFIGFG